jgi:hypothetical protein
MLSSLTRPVATVDFTVVSFPYGPLEEPGVDVRTGPTEASFDRALFVSVRLKKLRSYDLPWCEGRLGG